MQNDLAEKFRAALNEMHSTLLALSPELAETPWRDGGWTRKQIVGHLLDSATNKRQRFVRASIDGAYTGPGYAQDAWVAAHGYERQPWTTLILWWEVEHEILMAVVDSIPAGRLDAGCVVGDNAPVTCAFSSRITWTTSADTSAN